MYAKILVCATMLLIATRGTSQETRAQQREKTNELHKDRSAVERFDHSILHSETQKERKRMEQEQKREQLLAYLDTVSISDKLRRNMRHDMDNNPFSSRFRKFLARYKKDMAALKANTAVAQQK